MSSVTVKKMKVAAARRPAGGAVGSVALESTSAETSSGSVINGSGAVRDGFGFCGVSAMRLMEVYVRFVAVTWIFRRFPTACESWWMAIASVRKLEDLPELRGGRALLVRVE